MRSSVVLLTVIIVLLVHKSLDTFIAVAGSIFGMVNVLLLPSLTHLILAANTKAQKCFDYLLICFACIMICILPYIIIYKKATE